MPHATLTRQQAQEAHDALQRFGTQPAAAAALGITRPALQRRLRAHEQYAKQQAQQPPYDIESLRPFASMRQLEFLAALETAHGNLDDAADELCVDVATMRTSLDRLRVEAAKRGVSPEHDMVHPCPPGFAVKGTSTYYGDDGKPRGQWVKTREDAAAQFEMLKEAVSVLADEVRGLSPHVAMPGHSDDDLLAVVPIGDPHFGMLAWARECGDDFDSDIARRLALGAIDRLMQSGPAAKTAIILPLGDVFHINDQTNVTPGHKHQLDADSRFVKVLGVGIEAYRHIVLRALAKHENVIVRFVSGNHDPSAIWALAYSTAAYFANDPRVTVDLSPSKFWFHRFGRVLIGATHGDTVKPAGMLGVMAADRAEDWGLTRHRYFYYGHIHHSSRQEFPGLLTESFRTLAPKDAYAAAHGYRAGRDMVLIVHHREHGEIERHRCDAGAIA